MTVPRPSALIRSVASLVWMYVLYFPSLCLYYKNWHLRPHLIGKAPLAQARLTVVFDEQKWYRKIPLKIPISNHFIGSLCLRTATSVPLLRSLLSESSFGEWGLCVFGSDLVPSKVCRMLRLWRGVFGNCSALLLKRNEHFLTMTYFTAQLT